MPDTKQNASLHIMHIDEENNTSAKSAKISDVIRITLRHWPWIIVSAMVCTALATFYVLRQQPTYKRTSMVVIKEESGGTSIGSQLSAFAGMGMFSSNTNIRDEINKLQSPDIMEEVVRNLRLNISYAEPGRFHDKILYGDSLPVIVDMPQLTDEQGGSFMMHIAKNGDIKLSDFQLGDIHSGSAPVDFVQKAPVHFGKPVETPMGLLLISQGPKYKPGTEYELKIGRQPIIVTTTAFQGKIDIKLLDQWANTLELTASDNVLQRADDILDNIIKVYNESWVQTHNATTKASTEFINERLVSLERELGGVDYDIAAYQSDNLVPSIAQSTMIYMQDSQAKREQLQLLTNQITIAQYMLNYMHDPKHADDVLPANIGISSGIEASVLEYNKILLERNRLAANSTSNHPLITGYDTRLREMRTGIEQSLSNAIASLNTQIRTASAAQTEAKTNLAKTPGQSQHILSIERKRKVMESLYTFLLQKREENQLSQAFTPYNTEVIAKPNGPMKPVSPKKKLVIALAFLFGAFLPFGYNFIRESTNTKVRDKKELEGMTIPLIGEIPWWKNRKSRKQRKAAGINEEIVVEPSNRNVVNDAFRVLRTNLNMLSKNDGTDGEGHKIRGSKVMLTSIDSDNGKSFITVNLAVALALRDKKVMVVDGDMRHGTTSEIAGSPTKGLSNYLSGSIDDWRKLVVTNPALHGADVMPVGYFPPNPTELLETERFSRMLDEMARDYDYVLIDCTPINSMADSRVIEKVCDRCLFVVRIGHLERTALPELEKMYRSKELTNMAIILNGVEPSAGLKSYYSTSEHV